MYSLMKRVLKCLLPCVLFVLMMNCALAEEVPDLDLSACNRSITYAQMMQVCNAPAEYDGKLIRLKGQFNYSEKQQVGRIIVVDVSGCCETALDFYPAGTLSYPEEYPPLYSQILLTGRLTVDAQAPENRCYFTDAVIEWEK